MSDPTDNEEEEETEPEGDFDLEALGVLRHILKSRAARRASLKGGRNETGEDAPVSPWEEEGEPAKEKAPRKPPGKTEHPIDNYARDGRRRRLHGKEQ